MSSRVDTRRALRTLLEDLRDGGVEVLPLPSLPDSAAGDVAAQSAVADSLNTPAESRGGSIAAEGDPQNESSFASTRPDQGALFQMDGPKERRGTVEEEKSAAETLDVLTAEVAACIRCTELATTRTQTVFADGSPKSRLVFVGEAPGADEDAQGKPFVGRAGKLLTDMIERGMKLRRGDVYIMNILKCRPPGNRNPLPHEACNCRPFLLRQIELVNPEFICCLGAVAAQNLLETTQPIGKLRGRFHDWRGIQVLCTYHPAYLLRNPDAKRPAWEDLQLLMEAMDLA